MTDYKPFVFRFGEFEVWEREFQLIKAGETVPVEPKAFRVLLFLLRNPGRLVTKDEILNAVWSGYSVSDNSLTRSIATEAPHLGYWGSFAVTEEGLYLVDSDAEGGPAVMYYDSRTRQIKRILTLAGNMPFLGQQISPHRAMGEPSSRTRHDQEFDRVSRKPPVDLASVAHR